MVINSVMNQNYNTKTSWGYRSKAITVGEELKLKKYIAKIGGGKK